MPAVPLFDTHIVVDWSARSKPSPAQRTKDSIFWAVAHGGIVDGPPAYATTRNQAVECLTKLVAAEHEAGRRVLLGMDFPFGYPTGVARDLTGSSAALALWKWLAECVEDDERNRNNRFEVASRINRAYAGAGPCWGRPASWNLPEVPTRKPERGRHTYPPEKRLTEVRASGAKAVWQLYGAGSVGSQVLLGLPALEQIRNAPTLHGQVAVWPFDDGLEPSLKPIVIADVYPSLLSKAIKVLKRPCEIADEAQVRINAQAFASMDATGHLAPLFQGPPGLAPAERRQVIEEEGWILGVGFESELREAARGHSYIGALRDSVIRYDDPFEPAVPASDWSALH